MTRHYLNTLLCVLIGLGVCVGSPAIAEQGTGSQQSRVLLLLKQTEAQHAALKKLLAEQQDPRSPQYHKWLKPDEFGERFGASDAQIERVRAALAARGLALGKVHPNRLTLEVSGARNQLQQTFKSTSQLSHGRLRVARTIPSDLSGLIESVSTGHKLQTRSVPMTKVNYDRTRRLFLRPGSNTAQARGLSSGAQPLMTIDNGGTPFYGVTPGDLAVQYGLPSHVQGSGTTIKGAGAVIGVVSDYNVNLNYVTDYGTTFGISLPSYRVIVDGQDPGVFAGPISAYFELEAIGAIAPGATVKLYTAASESGSSGSDFALARAINDDDVNVLLYPYSACEIGLDEGEAGFLSTNMEAAAAAGITVIASAGDIGSAACDQQYGDAASNGLAVSALATSPFVTAVGGTDFYYGVQGTATQATYDQYWSTSTTAYTTQLGYIPEQAWNDSNQATDQNAGFSYLLAGGGGINTVGFDLSGNPLAGPYPQPSWQLGVVPSSISQTARVLPDVSFFAGDYTNNSAYVFCAAGTDCANTTNQNASNVVFTEGSGTEVASAVFAGIMGLVVGEHGAQGNANPTLYSMAGTTDGVFNDVVYGNNAVACSTGSPSCSSGFLVDQHGQPAYAALTGYDAATGLGSVNATALVQQWTPPNTSPTTTVLAILDASTNQPITSFQQGTHVKIQATVAGTGGTPTGDVAILTDAGQDASRSHGTLPLVSGVATQAGQFPNGDPVLPGGTYHIYARYAGDGTYQPSLSSGIALNVSKAPCTITVFSQSISSGATVPYGTPVSIDMEPFAATTPDDVINATGSISVKDNGTALTTFQLEAFGEGVFTDARFLPGSHSLSFTYNGDPSLQSCTLSPNLNFTVTALPTTTTLTTSLATIPSSTKGYYALTAVVTPSAAVDQGAFPAGNVTFKRSDGLVVASAVFTQGFYQGGLPAAVSTAYLGANALGVGNSSITATFTPTAPTGYAASTSSSVNVAVGNAAGLTNAHLTVSTADGGNVYYDTMSTLAINVSVAGAGTPTGTVAFFANGTFVANMTPLGNAHWTYVFDSSTTPTGLLPLAPGKVTLLAQYSGDAANSTDRQFVQLTILDDQLHPDYSLSAPADYKIITSGTTTAAFTVQLTPLNGFSGTVSFAATTPTGVSCSIPAPGTVTLGSTQFVTTTLTCSGLPTTRGRYLIDLKTTSTIASTTPNIATQIAHDLPLSVTVN